MDIEQKNRIAELATEYGIEILNLHDAHEQVAQSILCTTTNPQVQQEIEEILMENGYLVWDIEVQCGNGEWEASGVSVVKYTGEIPKLQELRSMLGGVGPLTCRFFPRRSGDQEVRNFEVSA